MISSGAERLGRGLLVRRREVVDFVHELLWSSGISSSSSSLLPSAKKAIQLSGHSHHWDLHSLTEDQRKFQSLASDFARREIIPFAAEWDDRQHFPVDMLRNAAQLGFGGIFCGEDVGGTGFGTEEQRQAWLPALTRMESLSSYCLTEPMSGSDAASLRTSARKDPRSTDYLLTGEKAFVSGGGSSDIYLVMARTGGEASKGISCFIVEKDMAGLSFGCQEDKLGWRSQPTAAVILDDVRVPEQNRIGAEGQGFSIALTGLDGGRINIGTCSVGGAQFCLDTAQDYVSSRKQFGRPIIDFQSTQFKLADMQTSVVASRLMVANAALALDSNVPWATPVAAMGKRFATDTCFDVCSEALQLHGGYGYLKDYPIERYLRDLRVHMILEGTNEIMRVVIARHMIQAKSSD